MQFPHSPDGYQDRRLVQKVIEEVCVNPRDLREQ